MTRYAVFVGARMPNIFGHDNGRSLNIFCVQVDLWRIGAILLSYRMATFHRSVVEAMAGATLS